MGWGYYVLNDGREAGYGVEAECDFDGCTARIDRGLWWLCGTMPQSDNEDGCGNYYCADHLALGKHSCEYDYCVECDKRRLIVADERCQDCLDKVAV